MSYLKSKRNRMKTKYSNILHKDFGIKMSDSPTNILVICNGGLCNGINQDMVHNVFEKYGAVESIIMVPGKCYSFLKYKDKNSAIEAFRNLNGEIIWSEIRGPICLDYVINVSESLLDQFKNFKKPPGLILIEDFITESEEELILDLVGFSDSESENSSELKYRKVRHYGYEFKYSTNNVDLSQPINKIPGELDFLWDSLRKYSGESKYLVDFVPDQLTINHYEPGQGIPPHVDTHSAFEDGIFSLSLQSSVTMDFKNKDGICYKVLLPRRSLCIMLGESRYDWTHGITPRRTDVVVSSDGSLKVQKREARTSLTFRKTRTGDCLCSYPRLCDSFMKKLKAENIVSDMRNIRLNESVASELEGNYVHEVYEKIASHFSETRHKPWPNVMKFVNSFDTGSILLDVGCGNGKYFLKQNNRFEIGCDSSSSLMQVCKQQGFECFSCNCLNIPIRDGVADGCICIAVIHHLTTEERRKKAITEIVRVLKSKGRALIYVWAKNQEKENTKSSYLKQYSQREKENEIDRVELVKLKNELVLPVHVNRTNFNHNDLLVPWKLKTKDDSSLSHVYLRFYHVYEDDELKSTCLQLDNVDVIDYYYTQGNWCILLQKK